MVVLVDRYEVAELLGSGGMGEVYAAYDRVLERRVAIKLIHENQLRDPTSRERFWREARAAARLSHPNTVAVFDLGEEAGHPFIVMELVEGPSLADRLEEGRLPLDEVMELSAAVLAGLSAAHTRGLVHRDVKPANILLPTDGVVKLADFGIAAVLAETDTRLTRTGQVVGTLRYLAPECADGQRATPASDLYALAVVIYECLAGRAPYEAATPMTMALAYHREPVPPLTSIAAHVPPAVGAVVEQALAKNPAARFRDADSMRRALVASTDPQLKRQHATAVISPPEGTPDPDRTHNHRVLLGWLLWLAACCGLVAYLLAAG